MRNGSLFGRGINSNETQMKNFPLFCILLLLFPLSVQSKTPTPQYRIMTCNIRITGLEEDAPFPERVWENRRDLCVNTVLKRKPDFFCLQEVIYDSNAWFKQQCKAYDSYGFFGPEMDSYSSGYHFIGKNVIFWQKKRYEFVSAGNYWLSETPLICGSMSWDTNRARHANWVRLRDRKTGQEFRLVNIHLDHKSELARREQIKIVMDECAQYSDKIPQILCGDFNAGIENSPIKYIRTLPDWREMYETVHGMGEAGFSAHHFEGENYKPKKSRRIDFIFYKGNLNILNAEYVKDHIDKMYPSDHFFILADFQMIK